MNVSAARGKFRALMRYLLTAALIAIFTIVGNYLYPPTPGATLSQEIARTATIVLVSFFIAVFLVWAGTSAPKMRH